MKIPDNTKPIDPKEYVFKFGKYKGFHFVDVWEKDPSYIDFCARENAGGLNLPKKSNTTGKIGVDKVWLEDQLRSVPTGFHNPDEIEFLIDDNTLFDKPKPSTLNSPINRPPKEKEEILFCEWPYPKADRDHNGLANFSWIDFSHA